MGTRRANRSGEDTRNRILDAALETVSTEGLLGTSARVIAKTGGFNQALVFYHFGSIDELLFAALEQANERRIDQFRPRLEAVSNLTDLVGIARDLHNSACNPQVGAVNAIIGAWAHSSDLGGRVVEILKPWDDLIAGALSRSLQSTPFAPVVPTQDLAHAVSALFLGIELLNRLGGREGQPERLFNSMMNGATMLSAFSGSPPQVTIDVDQQDDQPQTSAG